MYVCMYSLDGILANFKIETAINIGVCVNVCMYVCLDGCTWAVFDNG